MREGTEREANLLKERKFHDKTFIFEVTVIYKILNVELSQKV